MKSLNAGMTGTVISKTGRALGTSAAALVLGGSIFAGAAFAQAPAAKPPAKPPAAAAPPAVAADGAAQSSWVKLCEKGAMVGKDKDGKETSVEHTVCLTHHERIDARSGIVLVSAAIRQMDESKEAEFMVMLPLGMAIAPGMQVTAYPKDMWDKIQKGEKVDDSKLPVIKVPYSLCHSAGCTGEAKATPEMIDGFKSQGGLIVFGLSGSGRPVAFPVPLNGFDKALSGAPASNEEYAKQRYSLMQQIAQNQQKEIEDYRKQNESLQNSQGQLKPGTPAAAAPPAAPAPAPAKK